MKEGTKVGIYSDFIEIRESYNLFDSWDVSGAEIKVKSTDFNVKSANCNLFSKEAPFN